MAVIVLNDAYVEVDGSNLSTYVKSVTISTSADEVETTTMGNTGKTRTGGLRDDSISIDFVQSFAATELDSKLWPMIGLVKTFKVRPTSAVVGTSNPQYQGSVLVTEYQPVGNGVGELAETSVSWPVSGVVSRVTA